MAVVTSPSPAAYPRIMSPSVPQTAQREPDRLATLPHSSEIKEEEAEEEEEPEVVRSGVLSRASVALEPQQVTEISRENSKPSCCRKLIHQFEKEHTFHPKLNPSSLKLVGQRQHQPLITRLSEVRKSQEKNTTHPCQIDKNLTFAPKLNSLSIKLAQERAGKLHEVQSRAAALAAIRVAEMHSEYTFKPAVLGRSLRIAERLDVGFLGRQKQHMARRQQLAAHEHTTSPPQKPQPYKLTPQRPKQLNHNAITFSTPPAVKSEQFSSIAAGNSKLLRRRHSRSQTAPCLPVSGLEPGKPVLLLRQESDKVKKLFKSPSYRPPEEIQGLLQMDFSRLKESDRVKRVKVQAEKITRAKKVFQIKGGYQTIRKALRSRGWVENCYHNSDTKTVTPSSKKQTSPPGGNEDDVDDVYDSSDDCDSSESETEDEKEDDEEYMMLVRDFTVKCRAVRNCEPHFIWSLRRVDVNHQYLKKDQIVNHFSGAMFTTKFGLCENLHDLPWYGDVDGDTFFPRCYQLNSDEDKKIFKDDYQLTAAFNVLKIVACESNPSLSSHYGPMSVIDRKPHVIITPCNNISHTPHSPTLSSSHSNASISAPSTPNDKLTEESGQNCLSSSRKKREPPVIPEELVLLAIREVDSFLSKLNHEDIEGSRIELGSSTLTQEEWSRLLNYYYSLIFCNGMLFCSVSNATRAEDLLLQLGKQCPQLSIDGYRNIWIIKPGAMSRGRGIICKDHLQDILEFVNPSFVMKKNLFVVQKYIERPLLIYATKFDIRQWFLVTDWNPLTMWMYKDCYLRFSTQLYSLEKLDTSIHLCNNSVQKHLTNSQERSENLPQDNMWDSDTFQSYLKSIGEGDKWRKVIYPGMKQAIISVLQVSQDRVIDRKNTFELYGADFMISSDFKPWLIEINSSPTMEKSTAVTKKLCKQVMEDTIKVVIDRRNNRDCDIGAFELAYKQAKLDVPPYIGLQLMVEGSAIKSLPTSRSWRSRQIATPVPIIFNHH